MTHIAGHDRSQTLLLPESLDDYVGPENPVRFIEAFVDGLDRHRQVERRPGWRKPEWSNISPG